MGYTLAVYGEAVLTKNLIFDGFNDHLRFGPEDAEGYFTVTEKTRWEDVDLILAVDSAAGIEAMAAFNEWAARAGIGYTLVTRSGLKAKDLAEAAVRIVAVPDVVERVAGMLLEAQAEPDAAAGLALAVEPEAPGEKAMRLYGLTEGRVATYSVGEGLLPVDPAHYLPEEQPQPQPQPEAEPVAEITAQEFVGALNATADDLEFLEELEQAAEEAQRASEKYLDNLRRLIAVRRRTLRAQATGDVEVQTTTEPEVYIPSPIEPEQPEPEIKPTKIKREWLDPATGEWKPVGRGRPRKNVEVREVSE